MIHFLYNVSLTFLLILSAPYLLIRSALQRPFRKEIAERMGFFPDLSPRRPIWVHAASVGEVFCAIPLVKK